MTIDMHPWPPPPDRLSDLSDDILTHILSFAPTKEAASTTALSQRWRRPLWLDTAVVNLDSRSRTTGISDDNTLHFPNPDGRVIKKVSIVLRDTDIPGDAISKAVEAGFEELRLECQDSGCPDYTYATPSPSPSPSSYDVNLSLDMLQMSSLRVLDLTGCKLSTYSTGEDEDYMYQTSSTCWGCCYQPPNMSWDIDDYTYQPSCTAMDDISGDSQEHPWAPAYTCWCPRYHKPAPPHITFPWLEALRLRRCSTSLNTLQTLIDASYGLTTEIRLESLSILQQSQQVFLSCRGVETIVMANLHVLEGTTVHGCRIKLDAPHLRCLRLTQSMCSDTSFSLESPTPHLERVHLATHSAGQPNLRSSVLNAVSHIRFLKLTVYSLTDLIGDSDELPLLFPNLERLDIEELTCGGRVLRNHGLAASAVVSMLRKCTALRELRFKFSWRDYLHQTVPDQAIRAAAMSDFRPCGSINAGDDEDCCCEGSELSWCRGCRLDCLKGSLRRVVVEFDTEELTCFQVRLVKFLVENATFLEEVVIKGRNRYESGWIDRNVAKWRDSHGRHLDDKEEAERVCFYCCTDAGSLSMPPPTTPIPIWPPSLSEFPPLNNPLFSSGEVEDDDDNKDISHSLK